MPKQVTKITTVEVSTPVATFEEQVRARINESRNQLTRAQAEQIVRDQLAHDLTGATPAPAETTDEA